MKVPSKKDVSTSKGKLQIKVKNLMVKSGLKKKRKLVKKPRVEKGVVYLSHIPHGFYEEQIRKYFTQFGKVTNLSVPRSKTGRLKGFAFIEFKHPEVAEIAAETMNNYLMFNRLLKAKYISPRQQKPYLFKAADRAKATKTTVADKARQAVVQNRNRKNKHLNVESEVNVAKRLLMKKEELEINLEKLGFDYKFEVRKANLLLKRGIRVKKRKKPLSIFLF
uniref:RRM domain-containing protein n=1 Tax=Graphocephala atropunctata TaxID=36148 RepID=A0A1B6LXL2_9HEMI